MTTEHDPRSRIVMSWLREDGHEDAERVLLRTLDEVDTTPQRRPVRPARRFAEMNSYAKLAIVAAAIVVVAIAGIQLLPGTGTSGGQPTATPSPTSSPTLGPTDPPLTSGSLVPGRYAFNWSGPPTSLEVPAGWTGGLTVAQKGKDSADVMWGGWSTPVTRVYSDACRSQGALKPVDGTLQGLVDALDAQVGTDATISHVTLGGHPATRIDLVPAALLDRASCSEGADGPLKIWADPGPPESNHYALYPGARGIVHVLEVDGKLVVFTGITGPETSAGDLAELEAVIASTRIGP